MNRNLILIGCGCLIGLAVLITNQQLTAQSQSEVAKAPSIKDFAWIAGHWQGEAMGGKFEETWNPPMGGTMMGMFKLAKGDDVRFYELLTIVKQNDSFVLRLKHFDAKLVGWEEKDKAEEFPLIKVTETEAQFKGLRFVRVDKDHMNILVNVGEGDSAKVVKFACQRAKQRD